MEPIEQVDRAVEFLVAGHEGGQHLEFEEAAFFNFSIASRAD